MNWPQTKETKDSNKIMKALFEHCTRAADRSICSPLERHDRHDGGSRQAAAVYSELLAVIAEAGLMEEWRQYSTERREKHGKCSCA